MSLYYQDELDRLCECGCGTPVIRRFVSGHNRRGVEKLLADSVITFNRETGRYEHA